MTRGHPAPSLAPSCLPLKSCSLRVGCVRHRMDPSSRAQDGKSAPQKGRKVTALCPPFSWGGGWPWLLTNGAFLILLPPAWAALELSRGAVGRRGVSRRGVRKGGVLVSKVDHCLWLRCGRLPQPHQAGLAKSHSPLSPTPSLSFSGLSTICPDYPPPSRLPPSLPPFSPMISSLITRPMPQHQFSYRSPPHPTPPAAIRLPQEPPVVLADMLPIRVQLRPLGPRSPEQ